MPAVLSDTSVINYLATIGQVELLHLQFGKIFVLPAVRREIHAKAGLPGTVPADLARESGWLTVQAPKPCPTLDQLFAELDTGEAEAIALACELKPAIVSLDEADGRMEARRLGLAIIGTVGILVTARQSGQLKQIKPLLDRLIQAHRFRLNRNLYDQLVAGDNAD